ncbi:hypothetical protein DFJ77DRAFT_531669 [Powellomyces hirtus]|nr:hypothetical protein DFJ77DRAFT_531669 [Powellomyces hirtus]
MSLGIRLQDRPSAFPQPGSLVSTPIISLRIRLQGRPSAFRQPGSLVSKPIISLRIRLQSRPSAFRQPGSLRHQKIRPQHSSTCQRYMRSSQVPESPEKVQPLCLQASSSPLLGARLSSSDWWDLICRVTAKVETAREGRPGAKTPAQVKDLTMQDLIPHSLSVCKASSCCKPEKVQPLCLRASSSPLLGARLSSSDWWDLTCRVTAKVETAHEGRPGAKTPAQVKDLTMQDLIPRSLSECLQARSILSPK